MSCRTVCEAAPRKPPRSAKGPWKDEVPGRVASLGCDIRVGTSSHSGPEILKYGIENDVSANGC
jgi:hypothetical protein